MINMDEMNQQADQYINQKSYGKAIEVYNHLLDLCPDSARFHALRGYCYSMTGEHEMALRDYSAALVLKPDVAMTLYQRGLTYERLGQYDNALLDYQKSGEILPEYDVFFNMGTIYHYQNELEKGRKCYRQAFRLNPEHQHLNKVTASLMRKIKKSSGLRIEKIPSLKRFSGAESMVRAAQEYINRGDCEKACELYDTLMEQFPESDWLYLLRGSCCFYMADYEAALRDFTIASSLTPDNPSTWFNRAKTYAKLKRYSEAIQDLRKSWERSPQYDIYLALGIIRAENAEYGEARKAYLQALQIKPGNRIVISAINSLMRKIKNISSLRVEKNESIQYAPAINAIIEEAQQLIKKGECERAISLYDSLVKQFPNDVWIYYLRGRCFFFMEDYQNALNDFSFELAMNKQNADALFNRAQAYAVLEEFDSALDDLNKSASIRPEADIHFHMGMIFRYRNQPQLAQFHFDKANHFIR